MFVSSISISLLLFCLPCFLLFYLCFSSVSVDVFVVASVFFCFLDCGGCGCGGGSGHFLFFGRTTSQLLPEEELSESAGFCNADFNFLKLAFATLIAVVLDELAPSLTASARFNLCSRFLVAVFDFAGDPALSLVHVVLRYCSSAANERPCLNLLDLYR